MLRKLAIRPDWQVALAITVALRVLFSAIAAAFSFFVRPDFAVIRSNALTENLPASGAVYNALLGVWERFDTLWYLHIAQHGYDQPMAVIFYPLYPALIRVVSGAVPGTAAALVVSTVAAFFSFWGLLCLAESERTERGRMETLLVLAAWPSSFVLFAGYAESLTLALIVWAVICARGTMGAGDAMRNSGGTEPAFGCAGRGSAVRIGVAQPACAIADGGSFADGIARLLGLAAVVGADLGGGSLPCVSGSYARAALGKLSGGRTVDRGPR